MAIFATLPNPNLFSNLPTNPPPPPNRISTTSTAKPPIPIPKHRPKSPKYPHNDNPAFKTHHRNSKYHKPVKPGQQIPLPDNPSRAVVVGPSGISYKLPNAPFEFMYSYSETPSVQPLALREPAFLPFAPASMPRPWTGKAPMKKSKRNIKLFEPLGVEDGECSDDDSIGKRYEMLKGYELMRRSEMRPREEVLGEPLMRWEVQELLKRCLRSNRQVNLGRDGLTHNMLELIHTHWRRQPVCKVRCLGVPTVDMNNICWCLEEKTGGKIIHRVGGVVYLFRGRNYDHSKRPQLPLMLWKPATPVYPKLIQDAPEGLTKEEADDLRKKGKNLPPICKLAKNGVYTNLVRDVRCAFEGSILVKIDCKGMHASDYKKLGAKLKELVPCVLLSFDDEQVLMWRGRDWKSMYDDETPTLTASSSDGQISINVSDSRTVKSSPKMMSLWQRAIESGKASVLDETELSPDELLSKVEEFDVKSQAIEHSYPAMIYPNNREGTMMLLKDDDSENDDYSEDEFYDGDDADLNDKLYDDSALEVVESSVPMGSLPIDLIAKQLSDSEDDL